SIRHSARSAATTVHSVLEEPAMTNRLMPTLAPPAARRGMYSHGGGIEPSGCSVWKWIECGAAFAACAGLSGPAFIACIAAVAGGAYSAYRTHSSRDAACQTLQSSIITVMERNIPPGTKRGLLHKDVAEFEKTCAKADPDSWAVFQAAVKPDPNPQTAPVAAS